MKITSVFIKTIKAIKKGKRVIVNYGGSSSSKTISTLQILRVIAENKPNQFIMLIARSVPKLKTTLIKDFKNVVMGDDYESNRFNKLENIYEFPNGSIFKFANAYDEDTYKGVRCDYALLDECNTYRNGKGVFDQIDIRLAKVLFLTFNPSSKFWVEDVMKRADCEVIHSTYLDNDYCLQEIKEKLELRAKIDENFYKVYVLGEWGVLEGVVFKYKINWDFYEIEPENYDNEYFGGDFGFTNDPTTAVRVLLDRKYKTLYCSELLYEKGLLNSQIAEILKPKLNGSYIVFDSAEPKSIVSLRNEYGLNAISAVKGADSVRFGIERLKEYKILIHKDSKNMINEFYNYAYLETKEGIVNEPIDDNNHTIDPLRYIALKYKL